jgi:hypothetical protein
MEAAYAMTRIIIIALIAALGMATVPASAATTVWRWTDSSGITHFANAKPSNSAHHVEKLDIHAGGKNKGARSKHASSIVNRAQKAEKSYLAFMHARAVDSLLNAKTAVLKAHRAWLLSVIEHPGRYCDDCGCLEARYPVFAVRLPDR